MASEKQPGESAVRGASEDVRCAILDVDGTLVDSNDAHAAAWVEALREYGFDVAQDRVRELIGKGGDKLLPEVIGLSDESPRGSAISERRGAIFKKDYLPALRAFPSARALLARMRDEGLKLVVASSARRQELGALLRIAGADDLIEETTSSDDAERSKPDPDIVHAALARAGTRPAQSVMLGDTPYDVSAASRAGVRSVALRCGGWSDAELAGALAIYDDAADLLRNFERSPFAARRG